MKVEVKKLIKSIVLLLVLLACGLDCDAAEKGRGKKAELGKVELGKAALEVLYVGNTPASVEEAARRFVEPRKKFCLVEKVWDKKKEKWVYREVKRK